MKNIDNFYFFLLNERLHINKEVDEFSDRIYHIIKNSKYSVEITKDIPAKLNIHKLIVDKISLPTGVQGRLNLSKSKKLPNNKWVIYLELKQDFDLSTLKHEMNHALRLTLMGKDRMIKNLNYIKSNGIFRPLNNKEIEKFFYTIYLANDEEINASISEANGVIKAFMLRSNIAKLSSTDFEWIIKTTDSYKNAIYLEKFTCESNFKNFDKNQLNKFFYIFEENKKELDKIQNSKIRTLKLLIKAVKDIFNNNLSFTVDDDYIYKPNKDSKFYNKWINSQGKKLKRSIFSIFDHYS